jgi:hypothetical protein
VIAITSESAMIRLNLTDPSGRSWQSEKNAPILSATPSLALAIGMNDHPVLSAVAMLAERDLRVNFLFL